MERISLINIKPLVFTKRDAAGLLRIDLYQGDELDFAATALGTLRKLCYK